MRRQERKNTARLEKMTGYRLRIQQLTLIIRSTLHTEIIPKNQHTKADRRAGLFRAFLARFEPKDGDTTANRVCLEAIVTPTGVDLLR